MDPHKHWYTPPHPQYRRASDTPQEQTPNSNNARGFTNAASQSVQNAQQLLASYPMASATPTVHVARHLGSLNITAAPPSYVQPGYYSSQPHPHYAQNSGQHPPQYSEYNQQISYLSGPQPPSNQNAYWDNARDTSVRMLNEQASHSYNFQPPRHPHQQHWPQSTYQTPPFAQSVFQRTVPSSAYPTPPPPASNNSYSSLAFALGPPTQQNHSIAPTPPAPAPAPVPPQNLYKPTESSSFFNDFLERKTEEMKGSTSAPKRPPPPTMMPPPSRLKTPPPKTKPKILDESPDPLSLRSNELPSRSSVSLTPQKRKPVVEIQSPSSKRMLSYKSLPSFTKTPISTAGTPRTPATAVPLTPSTASRTNASGASSRLPFTSSKSTSAVTPTPNRIVNRAYVFIPPSPSLTPSSRKGHQRMKDNDTPDLGGYGSEEDPLASPVRRRHLAESPLKGSARRTGDRDERGPLEKFVSGVEEIFEMEDSLASELTPDDLPADYFSSLSTDCSRPMLSTSLIRKLSKYIGQISRPSKRMRQVSGMGHLATPRGRTGRMSDVDVQLLSRFLKTLDRSVRAGEDLDPFPQTSSGVATTNGLASAKSSPVKKSRKSKKAKEGDDEGEGEEQDMADELNQNLKEPSVGEVELEKLTRTLDLAIDSIVAADCCIALLASDRLPKQIYSEELITGCLNAIKSHLTRILYPFVEASSPEAVSNKLLGVNPLLVHIVKPGSGSSYSSSMSSQDHHRRQMSDLFQCLSAVLPRINALVNAESVAMSDSIIIQTVYIAIGPFFVVEPGTDQDSSSKSSSKKDKEKESVVNKTLGKSAMRGLRLDALSLIRSIFANHDDQRSWIIEEILSSLIKLSDTKQKAGQFRLRDGRSIRTVSALLLQLVQTSAHDVRLHARSIEKQRQNKFAMKRQESFSESQGGGAQQAEEPFLDEIDKEEIRLYGTGLESATKAAKTIILFLNSRSGKGKATKNSNEAEYRAIFDNLIEDLLAVLYWPEWPAAGLLLSIASKFMVSSLDDVKSSSSQADTNAAKTMALDHLGVIAARIRSSTLKVQKGIEESGSKYRDLKPLDEVVSKLEGKQFSKVMEAHRDVAAHLSKRSLEDQAYDSARELTAATLCQELATALKQVNISIEHPDDDDDDLNLRERKDQKKVRAFGDKLKAALREVWKDPATDVFDIGSQEEATRIDRVAEEIGTIQSLKNSFHPILNVILMALDAPAIFMRTKALRALGQIVMSDSTILAAPNVRRGIESHLLDSSPAVRDAAVELIGKYMIDSPEVAGDYYQKIADRMADTGLGVRKRVIKLLKSFYGVTDDTQRKIDISTRLVLRMMDEDDTVKELATKTVEELWFPSVPIQSAMKKSGNQSNQDKSALLTKVSVIMGTAANFKDRQSPLEDILHKIMAEKQGNEASSLHDRYTEICETLIEGLVDATDLPGFTIINCIRTIYLFTAAYPSILSGSNASTLLPYLKNASTPEEVATSDYLLKIFRLSVPHMPKTAAKFGNELQSSLQPMIIKPSGGGGIHVLQEAVACMCVVVDHLTHDFTLLINLLKSCNARLIAFLRPNTAPADTRPMLMLIFIVALLGEHCNFDRLRRERENLAADINAISEGSIMDHIYLTLLRIYKKFDNGALRGRILQCLGFLFRAQPTLMTKEQSAEIMDAIFESPEEEGRGRLLRIMQDFLISESEKHSAKEKESSKNKATKSGDVNMDELVGNTDGFADSGVSSAIVQRYLTHILDAALSQNAQIQAAAIDVLTFTIKQGLAHPLQSFPVIIALETSPYPQLSNRATALHSILNSKHASLINTRYSISARKSFDYQKKIADGPVRGFRLTPSPIALLQRWYSLVREKRQARQDFLKAMVKVFAENGNFKATQDDVDFTRYMAENFATFEYKTQEEVFTIIKYLTTVLSTTGMQLLDVVSPSHLLSQIQSSSQAPPPPPSTTVSLESIPVAESDPSAMDVCEPTQSSHTTQSLSQPQAQASQGRDQVPLMRTSVIVAMVMLLKAHLKSLYSLSEDKCNKFVIGKKSAIGDKPAVKRHENPLSWDRLPYATTPIHTTHDAEIQRATFLDIWNEDGVSAEPEDEDLLL